MNTVNIFISGQSLIARDATRRDATPSRDTNARRTYEAIVNADRFAFPAKFRQVFQRPTDHRSRGSRASRANLVEFSLREWTINFVTYLRRVMWDDSRIIPAIRSYSFYLAARTCLGFYRASNEPTLSFVFGLWHSAGRNRCTSSRVTAPTELR